MDSILKPTFHQIYDEKTCEQIAKDFSRLDSSNCYLDHAGATLYSDQQMKNVCNDLSSNLYKNPHSSMGSGDITSETVERTRLRILDFFNASSDEYSLVFTSGATGSLKCIAESFIFTPNPDKISKGNGNFVYLQDNHTSVLGMRDLVGKKSAKITCLTRDEAFDIFSSNNSEKDVHLNDTLINHTNSLFIYPAQCNFSGFKYPLNWIEQTQSGILNKLSSVKVNKHTNWFVLIDAASFVGTNELDLSVYKPDFVALSFYKMFGYPTGTGALIVKNSSVYVLEKNYYGGGSVNMVLSTNNYHIKRDSFTERFEDGTVSFLSIVSLNHGLDILKRLTINKISHHVFSLVQYLHHNLLTLHHNNGNLVVKLYVDSNYDDINIQGGIITFNLLRSNGSYVGFTEVHHMADLYKIHLRVGCFCNPGACQRHLNLTNQIIINNYDAGFKCGNGIDLINGRPTGAIRISFGYMSTLDDIQLLLAMIKKCFVSGNEIIQIPKWYNKQTLQFQSKYKKNNQIGISRTLISNKNEINSQLFSSDSFKPNDCDLTVVKLFIYPIKSCGGFEITRTWTLNNKGLKYDREWMIINSSGICLSQKHISNLCLIKPTILKDQNTMELDYPGMPTIKIALDYPRNGLISDAEVCKSRVCGHRVEGWDCGSEVSEWLSLAIGQPNLKLIRQHDKQIKLDKIKTAELSFASQAQYLLINQASIDWLISQIPDDSDCNKETVLNRFRGNIIVKGANPFTEESWGQVKIGKAHFQVNGICTRCQMVCIDQTTGLKTVEPLRLLAQEFEGKMKFGIYLTKQNSKSEIISVGNKVSIMYK